MKKNILFFTKFAGILCAVAVLIGIANAKYIRGYYYTDVYNEVQKFQHVPYHITFANFGSSHGLASFRYDKDDTASFNFALSGEDIYHDFQTLKQFSGHLEQGCVVTLPVSYFSFCLSTEEPSQKRYYTYLDKQYIRGFRYETLINSKYLPVLRSIEYLFKDIIGDEEINVENFMDDAAAMQPAGKNAAQPQAKAAAPADTATADEAAPQAGDTARMLQLDRHAVTRAESWRSGRMYLGKAYMKENIALLEEMIRYCEDKGFQPVLITTPVYHSLTEAFTGDELTYYFYDNIAQVVRDTGVLYIDYTQNAALTGNPAYYNNSDHMSTAGGDVFLTAYKQDLAKKGITQP